MSLCLTALESEWHALWQCLEIKASKTLGESTAIFRYKTSLMRTKLC
jgi:hypothetical protein